ncbi:MAG: hypothetical protein FJX74_10070 [Armatimonadetes bacterium]|nr:hypothetical protein [Armatimonadota bacterium]
MPSVTVKRSVLLKAVVTEKLKQEVAEELQEAADEVARRIEELDTAGRRYISDLQRTDLQRAMALRGQVEGEKRRQQEVRDQLLQRREAVGQWELGSEVVRGTIEGVVEVNEGDNLAVLLGGAEIVVEDDLVKAIRQLSAEELSTRLQDSIAAAATEEGAEADVLGRIETP